MVSIIILFIFLQAIIAKEDKPNLSEIIIFLLLFICQIPFPSYIQIDLCLAIFTLAVSFIYIIFARRDQWVLGAGITILSCILIPSALSNGIRSAQYRQELFKYWQKLSMNTFEHKLDYQNIALSSNSKVDNLLPSDVKQPVNTEKANMPAGYKPASWQEYIISGKTFYMIFDKTSGKFDHIGTLKMGETYTLTYTNGKFICTGFNLGTNNVGTWAYSNCDPRQMKISLWGRGYTYNEKGDIIDSQYGLVGHLSSAR